MIESGGSSWAIVAGDAPEREMRPSTFGRLVFTGQLYKVSDIITAPCETPPRISVAAPWLLTTITLARSATRP